MPTVDLSRARPQPTGLLAGLPRRVALTLPELRVLAERAGGAPLPFDPSDGAGPAGAAGSAPGQGLAGRLGGGSGTPREAYEAALAGLHDPVATLTRRGLLAGGTADPGVVGALGLLAAPAVALDLDVVVGAVRARGWHRCSERAVASVSTADGVVFELAWMPVEQWPRELARVAVIPEDHPRLPPGRGGPVPRRLDLPFGLLDAAATALADGRGDLVDVLVPRYPGGVRGEDGRPVADVEVPRLLRSLAGHAEGRLRGLVADVSGPRTAVVGVVSWTLLPDGWRALRAHRDPVAVDDRTDEGDEPDEPDEQRVEVVAVEAADLGAELAPVLAQVTR